MSGLEVVGVVLGSIPLVVSALEHYKEGLRTVQIWRKYARELGSLVRQLQMQKSILINVCEALLDNIVPAHRVDAMLKDPFGKLWQEEDTSRKLESRLRHDLALFEVTVHEMMAAIEEVKFKLDLGPNGQVKWMEGNSFRRELKRVTFTFSRGQYQDLLSTLKEGNKDLALLTKQHLELEPKRKVRFQGNFFNVLREVSRNVYNALRSSISCSCAPQHSISLELSSFKGGLEDDEKLAASLAFRIAFSSKENQMKSLDLGPDIWRWDELKLQLATPPAPEIVLRSAETQPQIAKPKKSVRFFKSTNSEYSSTESQSSTVTQTRLVPSMNSLKTASTPSPSIPLTPSPFPELRDLCSTISRGKTKSSNTFGYVTDLSSKRFSKFGVYPLEACEESNSCSVMSLNDVLGDDGREFPVLGYQHQIKLAYLISYSVLQLCKTPWLSDVPTSKDIVFIQRDCTATYEKAFVMKRSLRPSTSTSSSDFPFDNPVMRYRNRTVIALGIVLIELMFLQPFETLCKPFRYGGGFRTPDQQLDISMARKLADQVAYSHGLNIGSAIQSCLDWYRLDDEEFQQKFYSSVVAPLEKNVVSMEPQRLA